MHEQMPQSPPAPLTPAEERQWAMIAHFGVLLNLVSGFLGPVVPLALYMIYKDRSRYVAYHSLQGLVFQLIWWVGGGFMAGAMWVLSGVLSAIIIGLLCIPFACLFGLMPIVALGYGVYGGIQASQGQDFKYWLIGDWVRKTLTG